MELILAFLSAKWLPLLLTAVTAYLLGSLSPAIFVGKLFAKEDIRDMGSGNAGATNVLRSLGALPAIITTAGDLAKSIAAALLGGWLMTALGTPFDGNVHLAGMYLAGACCIIGHLYPLYHGFRGGKGVMATLGMLLVLDWRVALLSLGFFIVVVSITKYVSLGSILSAVMMTILTFVFRYWVDGAALSLALVCTIALGIIGGFLIFKHSENIRRLKNGTESKLSFRKKKPDAE